MRTFGFCTVVATGISGAVLWTNDVAATSLAIALISFVLAWLMAQKPWIVPIPGTTQMAHMLENTGAAAVRFTQPEIAELNASVAAIKVEGARLPEMVQAMSGVEAAPKN